MQINYLKSAYVLLKVITYFYLFLKEEFEFFK